MGNLIIDEGNVNRIKELINNALEKQSNPELIEIKTIIETLERHNSSLTVSPISTSTPIIRDVDVRY